VRILAVVVVVILVIAGVGVYFALRHSSTSSCGAHQTANICVDQAEIPDSLDPAVTFSTPGWAAVQQVYQGLVQYNGSSVTSFVGVLATTNGTPTTYNANTGFSTYTFDLRQGVTFSNGDPYNAYVQWYSLYRSLLLEQGPQFILEQNFYSTNFDPSNPLNYYSPAANDSAANTTLVSDLNTWNFGTPTAAALADMEMPNQSFQVLGQYSIALNLGYGYLASNYTYLLASISAPNSYAVDPVWIDANGGITEGTVNDYAASNTMGTGPYLLQSYNGVGGGGYTLAPNPHYWGASAFASSPWNNNLAPANTSVQVIFQNTIDITTNDLTSGTVQGASFAYIGPSTILQLEGHSNIVVQQLPTIYGATGGSWWIFLDQNQYPFNNLSVRAAIAHAVNYQAIIQEAFGGYATQWVGPVPPAYPYNNNVTAAEPYYSFNPALAQQEIQASPCANAACKSTVFNYMYLNSGADWSDTASLLQQDLAAINITINPVGVSLDQLYAEQGYDSNGQCVSDTNANGGPFYLGQEFYTSDYISPDDWTQNNAYSAGSANACMSQYSNATMDSDVFAAASDSTPSDLTTYYANMTQMMYENYTDIWLVVPAAFSVTTTDLHGYIQNPMASAEPYALGFNTQWLS
jgi:peptide/nickel transport system substrate-binding protein